jgi:hypothetical protein
MIFTEENIKDAHILVEKLESIKDGTYLELNPGRSTFYNVYQIWKFVLPKFGVRVALKNIKDYLFV